MTYAIMPAPRARRKWKYGAIEDLKVGEAFMVPYSDLSSDASNTVRSVASAYSKTLGRNFRTQKDHLGVWIIRKA